MTCIRRSAILVHDGLSSRGSPSKDDLLPAEQPLDVGKLELDVGGAAVVAGTGTGRGFHLSQQRVHFVREQPAARAHRPMASHGRGDRIQTPLQRVDRVVLGDLVGEIAYKLLDIGFAEYGRRFPDCNRSRTETLYAETELPQRLCMHCKALGVVLRQIDDRWEEQQLTRHRPRGQRVLQRFVDQPFMRGVLVDDDQESLVWATI